MVVNLNRLWDSMLGIPHWVQIWLMILVSVNMVSLFFLDSPIGFWTAIAFGVVCIVNMPIMFIQGGLTRALSFVHIVWVPLIAFLCGQLFDENAIEPGTTIYMFGIAVIVVNTISLLFDVMEVYRWINGGREILGVEA